MTALFARSLRALLRRASRNILTILAVILSAATLAAFLGITASSASQTARRFTQMESSSLQVTLPASTWNTPESELLSRIANFHYIEGAGTLNTPEDSSNSMTITSPQWGSSITTNIGVATMAGLSAREAHVVSGTGLPSESGSSLDPFTVLLGARAASELGITMQQGHPVVSMNGTNFSVSGIVKDSESEATLSTAVIITPQTAKILKILPPNRVLTVRVAENTASAVGANLAAALYPSAPDSAVIKYPSNPEKLRDSLLADSQSLTFITAGIMTVVSAFSIINTMQIAIVERRKEIGIDMALGLSSTSIALQFLVESMLLGGIGALIGTLLGGIATGVASTIGQWPFIIPPYVALIPPFGLVVGALAGLLPAIRAARIRPAELLRSA